MFTVVITDSFREWFEEVSDRKTRMRIAARLDQAEAGNLGDWKAVGDGVSEMRIAFGPGYRLYFMRRGQVVIVMLGGGDKSSQTSDIRRAQRLAKELRQEEER
jgi:putative addiction module killer protein